jgi:hypothetical protein
VSEMVPCTAVGCNEQAEQKLIEDMDLSLCINCEQAVDFFLSEFSVAEIATRLGISTVTVESAIRIDTNYAWLMPREQPIDRNEARELGRRGGQQTAKRGPDYFRQIAAMRKSCRGGRPRKSEPHVNSAGGGL